MTSKVTKIDLLLWIKASIKDENFANFEINLLGTTEKGDGYNGDIVFATVIGTSAENEKKQLNLVVKHGKSNEHLRNISSVRTAFETEIHFYTKVIPAFRTFQLDHNVKNIFDAVPKCYKTMILDNMEVIVMEDSKKKGFVLYDRRKPLDLNHQKMVLAEYGKFHALSFALREKKPKEFCDLVYRSNAAKDCYKDKTARDSFQKGVDEAIDILKKNGDFSLVEKIKKALPKDAGERMYGFINEDISETVFTHGDCWNNNFMYKYEDDRQTSPSKVMILDWPMSSLRSPVFDISHFVYSTSSKEQLDKFEELMEVYYASFSTFLHKLDCDPEELFPYSALKVHWRKYSLYGILLIPLIMKFIVCEKEEAPDLSELKEGESLANFEGMTVKVGDLYYERVRAVLAHFVEAKF